MNVCDVLYIGMCVELKSAKSKCLWFIILAGWSLFLIKSKAEIWIIILNTQMHVFTESSHYWF